MEGFAGPLFWVIWYPLVFCLLRTLTVAARLARAVETVAGVGPFRRRAGTVAGVLGADARPPHVRHRCAAATVAVVAGGAGRLDATAVAAWREARILVVQFDAEGWVTHAN